MCEKGVYTLREERKMWAMHTRGHVAGGLVYRRPERAAGQVVRQSLDVVYKIGSRRRTRTAVRMLAQTSLRDIYKRQRHGKSKAPWKLLVRFLISRMAEPNELIGGFLVLYTILRSLNKLAFAAMLGKLRAFLWNLLPIIPRAVSLRATGVYNACEPNNEAISLGTWKFWTSSISQIFAKASIPSSHLYFAGWIGLPQRSLEREALEAYIMSRSFEENLRRREREGVREWSIWAI